MRGAKSSHSAYDLLDELRGKYPKIAPPTVYRALAALIESGQVHRLESLNAYVACQREDSSSTINIFDLQRLRGRSGEF